LRSSDDDRARLLEDVDYTTGDRFTEAAEKFDAATFLEHTARSVQQLPKGLKCQG
jgi:hypothetical protein